MAAPALRKFGTAYVIEESLLQAPSLEQLPTVCRADFEVVEQHTSRRRDEAKAEALVSTSLFNQSGLVPSGVWSFEAFDREVIASGSKEKYWKPLLSRRADYPGCWLRVYLAANLASLARPMLEEVGFDEVLVMAKPSEGFKTGMLWRYLPLAEEGWAQLFCTGIDRYSPAFRATMLEPTPSLTASVWMNRHFLPFAGPIAANPAWLRGLYAGYSMAQLMSGFLDAWEKRAPGDKLRRKVFDFTGSGRGRALATIDACCLWHLFWHRQMLEAQPRLVSQVFYEFLSVRLVPFMLGAVEG